MTIIIVIIINLQALVTAISSRPTLLNNRPLGLDQPKVLGHKDMFTVGDRSFRWEYPEGSKYLKKPAGSPRAQKKILTPHRQNNLTPIKSPKTKIVTPNRKPPASPLPASAPKGRGKCAMYLNL